MKSEFEELQNPPAEFLNKLVETTDEKRQESFLKNTMTLNNQFAFASVSSEQAPASEKGGREDWCKVNGSIFLFLFQLNPIL